MLEDNNIRTFYDFFQVIPVDRTYTLETNSNYPKSYKLDLDYKTDLELSSIINNRAKDLSKYKNLILFWSGGIDSTLVLYALVNNNIDFEIMISEKSKEEYELVYNQIINGHFSNIKEIFYLENYTHDIVKDKVIVTGELGDQIMGSMKYLDYTITELKESYHEHIPIEIIKCYDKTCQLVLKNKEATLAEYLWVLNFIFKYVEVITRFPNVLNKLDLDLYNVKLAHFFNTKDFQAWSIQHYKEHCSFDKIQDYKILYKQYIFNSNDDIEYFKNKIKVPSLVNITF